MLSPIAQISLISCGAYGVWSILRRVLAASPLDNIPGPPPKSFFTGNLLDFHNPDGWEFHKSVEEDYADVVKIQGQFGTKSLFVSDPAALHSIIIKDADIFEEGAMFVGIHKTLFGHGILSSLHEEHRMHRKMLIPAFSTPNLRRMTPLFYEIAERLRDSLSSGLGKGPQKLDMYPITSQASLQFIGRAGVDADFDSLFPDPSAVTEYARVVKDILPAIFRLAGLLPLLPFARTIGSPAFQRFMINIIPSSAFHKIRDMIDIMDSTAEQVVTAKKAAHARGELAGKEHDGDIMSILLKGGVMDGQHVHLSHDELVAQMSMMLMVGTDTTSAALNILFHVLAAYPEVQQKLRDELQQVPEHLNHDALVSLPYLDAVVRETLRLHPPVSPAMIRNAVKDGVLPLTTPIIGVDGEVITSIAVPKGTLIYIGMSAVNHSKKIWGEDALEFKPERWSNGKADSVNTKVCGVYSNTMTFIGGGRSCIGFKFSILEMKVILAVMVRAFKFSLADPNLKWRMSGITVEPSLDDRVQLPLIIERL